jgi:hypothetical protein
MFDNKKAGVLTGTAVGSLVLAGAASAQTSGPDVSAIVTVIGYAAVAGASIGVAVLSAVAGIKLYKWIKSAM